MLQWTADYLRQQGADSPRLDAEVLLAESLGCRRIELYTAFEDVPNEGQRANFRELVRRRAEGMPVAYLVGRKEFYSLEFAVTPAVLIPRPETELLVLTLVDLARAMPAGQGLRIADVGTGSGIIAICAAKHLARSQVTALDNSPAALEVARRNVETHGVCSQVELLESDLLTAVESGPRFDFILSNPPYVKTSEWAGLPKDVREFEPRGALVAGDRGTEVIEALVPQAVERLRPGGSLLLEIGPATEEAARAVLEAAPELELAPTIKDLARLPRVLHARRACS